MIYVRDLLKLDAFKKFELVSGESGLDRSVSWPNVAQTVSIKEWLVGGDVILMSGIGLDITDEFLTDIIIQAANGRAACIIMLINSEHIASIPKQAIDEAVKRGLAVFAAPWETKLSDVIGSVSMLVSNDRLEERMHSEFLDRLLSGEISYDDTAYQLSMEKYALTGEKIVAVIHYKFDNKQLNTQNHAYHNDRIMHRMISLFEHYFGRINYLNQYNRQVFIIPADNKSENDIVEQIRNIYSAFSRENTSVVARIGVGEIAQEPDELKKSYDQSRIARKSISKAGVRFYKELGIYQLLYYIDDTSKISEYVTGILSPLIEYDKKNSQCLLSTLREYLACMQNVSQAAQALYIHRNTMIKRVEKIEELLGYSLKDAQACNQLYNAIKIYDLFLDI